MDSTHSPGAVRPPPLNSDQLNYLIWRYLQEAGYGDAAVKLQRDWKVEPESLPFAKHIKGPALVSLVQKGLRYHHLSLTIDEAGRGSRSLEPSMFFFGPEGVREDVEQPLIRRSDVQKSLSPTTSSLVIPRKRESESSGVPEQTTHSTKRTRKTAPPTSERNGNGPRKTSATMSVGETSNAMDVDTVNGHHVPPRSLRSPSASETLHDEETNGTHFDTRMEVDADMNSTAKQPTRHDQIHEPISPLVPTLTNGDSIGIQVTPAKVANLGPTTAILSVAEDPHVTKIDWRPGDHSILTSSGHRTCGIWRAAAGGRESLSYQKCDIPFDSSLVSSFVWQSSHDVLAVATFHNPTVQRNEQESSGALHVFDEDLVYLESLSSQAGPPTVLKALPSGAGSVGIASTLEAVSSQDSASTITLWTVGTDQQDVTPATISVPETLIDLVTSSNNGEDAVFVAGTGCTYHCRVSPALQIADKWVSPTHCRDTWSFVRSFTLGNGASFVVAASGDTERLWLPQLHLYKDEAHTAAITGLEIRPRRHAFDTTDHPIEFATSSIDGSVKIWQYGTHHNAITLLHKLNMSQHPSIMSISYSPDGFCLAGASYGDVDIWNAEHDHHLMASWRASEAEWAGSSMREEDVQSRMSSVHGESALNGSEHRLAWDNDSKKLAFALGSQIAVINFQR